jgi:hypothetical protein
MTTAEDGEQSEPLPETPIFNEMLADPYYGDLLME